VFLPRTDELGVKVFSAVEEFVVITRDQVPMYIKMVFIMPETEDPKPPLTFHRRIPIEVSILGERAPLTRPIFLNLDFAVKFLWPPENSKPIFKGNLADGDQVLRGNERKS
jgi:hypothetical protein